MRVIKKNGQIHYITDELYNKIMSKKNIFESPKTDNNSRVVNNPSNPMNKNMDEASKVQIRNAVLNMLQHDENYKYFDKSTPDGIKNIKKLDEYILTLKAPKNDKQMQKVVNNIINYGIKKIVDSSDDNTKSISKMIYDGVIQKSPTNFADDISKKKLKNYISQIPNLKYKSMDDVGDIVNDIISNRLNTILNQQVGDSKNILNKILNYVITNNNTDIPLDDTDGGKKNKERLKLYIQKMNNLEFLTSDSLIQQEGDRIIKNLESILKSAPTQYDDSIDNEYDKIQKYIQKPLGDLCKKISDRVNSDYNGKLGSSIDIVKPVDEELSIAKDDIILKVKEKIKNVVNNDKISDNIKLDNEIISVLRKEIYNHLKTKFMDETIINDSAKKTPEIPHGVIKSIFIQIVEGLYGIIYKTGTRIADVFDMSGANDEESVNKKWSQFKSIVRKQTSYTNGDMDDIFITFFDKCIEIVDNDTSKNKLNYQIMLLKNYNQYNNAFGLTMIANSLNKVDKDFIKNKILNDQDSIYDELLNKELTDDEIKNISETMIGYIFKTKLDESYRPLLEGNSEKLNKKDKFVLTNSLRTLEKYKQICYQNMSKKYNDIDSMNDIESIKSMIKELNGKEFINMYRSYSRLDVVISMIKQFIVKNENFFTKIWKSLKSLKSLILNEKTSDELIKTFVKYMGRQPNKSDIKLYDEFYKKMKNKSDLMKQIIKEIIESCRDNYIFRYIHYMLSPRITGLPNELIEYMSTSKMGDEKLFLNQAYAYLVLLKIRQNDDASPTLKRLVDKITNGKDDYTERDIKNLIWDISIISNKISSHDLRTAISKVPLIRDKYSIDFEMTSNELIEIRPMFITEKSTNELLGMIVVKNYDKMFRNLSNEIEHYRMNSSNSGSNLV